MSAGSTACGRSNLGEAMFQKRLAVGLQAVLDAGANGGLAEGSAEP